MASTKKEFVTEWFERKLVVDNGVIDSLALPRSFYLGGRANQSGRLIEFILPESIYYWDLLPFRGKRTKVTIEVIES